MNKYNKATQVDIQKKLQTEEYSEIYFELHSVSYIWSASLKTIQQHIESHELSVKRK